MLEPASPSNACGVTEFEVDGDYAYVRDGDEVEVFDLKDLSSKFGPVDVDEDSFGTVYQGGKLITAIDDELIVINGNGDVDRESACRPDRDLSDPSRPRRDGDCRHR